jgi:hypothetical protein
MIPGISRFRLFKITVKAHGIPECEVQTKNNF